MSEPAVPWWISTAGEGLMQGDYLPRCLVPLFQPDFGVFNTILVNQPVTTTITNPEQVVFGLSYKLNAAWTVFGDYQFTRWGKRFSTLNINFANPLLNRVLYESYDNTSGFRFGASG